jgi:hypothetical protein
MGQDNSICIVTKLWAGQSGGGFAAGSKHSPVIQNIQTSSVAHLASCSAGIGGSFVWGQSSGCKVDYSPPTSAKVNNELSHISAPLICHHGMYSCISWEVMGVGGMIHIPGRLV